MPITQQQAIQMIKIRNAINAGANPDWIQSGLAHLSGVIVQGVECIVFFRREFQDYGDPPARLKMQMLMLSIWSAVLSDFIIKARGNLAYAASALASASKPCTGVTGAVCFDGTEYRFQDMGAPEKFELMIGLAAAKRVSVPLFESLLSDCGSGWNSLFQQFMTRNACVADDHVLSLEDSK